jgi:hypothetical protein
MLHWAQQQQQVVVVAVRARRQTCWQHCKVGRECVCAATLPRAFLLVITLTTLLPHVSLRNPAPQLQTCHSAASDVITVAKQRAMHRRHQSSGAALIGASRHKQQHDAAAAGVEHAAGSNSSSHMPHIHSSPSMAAAGAAAGGGGGGGGGGGLLAAAAGSSHERSLSAAAHADFTQQGQPAQSAAETSHAAAVFQFADPGLVLQPGEAVTLPMWLHLPAAASVAAGGRFEFQAAWFCEPQVGGGRLGWVRLHGFVASGCLSRQVMSRLLHTPPPPGPGECCDALPRAAEHTQPCSGPAG